MRIKCDSVTHKKERPARLALVYVFVFFLTCEIVSIESTIITMICNNVAFRAKSSTPWADLVPCFVWTILTQ